MPKLLLHMDDIWDIDTSLPSKYQDRGFTTVHLTAALGKCLATTIVDQKVEVDLTDIEITYLAMTGDAPAGTLLHKMYAAARFHQQGLLPGQSSIDPALDLKDIGHAG
jgi:hypothetical protein